MEIRKAEKKDLAKVLKHRMEFVASIREIEHPELFRQATKEYLQDHYNRGDLLIYLALDDGKIIASCMLSIFATMPTPSCLYGCSGRVLNVYTLEGFRRQGLATSLMRAMMMEARRMGVEKLLLDYTEDGHPLFQKLGFRDLDNQMEYSLPPMY